MHDRRAHLERKSKELIQILFLVQIIRSKISLGNYILKADVGLSSSMLMKEMVIHLDVDQVGHFVTPRWWVVVLAEERMEMQIDNAITNIQ